VGVGVRVCARDYNTTGFFAQGIKYRKRLVALVALDFCTALPALAIVQLVVAYVCVYTLVLVGQ
jgi:hypothetical protein